MKNFKQKALLMAILSTLALNAHADFRKKVDPNAVKPAATAPVATTVPPPAVKPAANVIVNKSDEDDGDGEYYADKAKAAKQQSTIDPANQKLIDDAKAKATADKRAKADVASKAKAEKSAAKAEKDAKLSEEKKKETETLAFLKANAVCGRSTTPGVSTTGSANAYNQIKANYSESNAPASVKKQIISTVDLCDKSENVGKYYKSNAKAPDVASIKAPEPAKESIKEDSAGKSASNFLSKLGHDITSNGVKEKACSPGETQMHANGC